MSQYSSGDLVLTLEMVKLNYTIVEQLPERPGVYEFACKTCTEVFPHETNPLKLWAHARVCVEKGMKYAKAEQAKGTAS